MKFEIAHGIVIDEVAKNPGINFNKLANKLKGKISRVKLLKVIKELKNYGILKEIRDKKHKQRLLLNLSETFSTIFFKLTYDIENINNINKDKISEIIRKLLDRYFIIIAEFKNDFEKKYAHYRLITQISKLVHYK